MPARFLAAAAAVNSFRDKLIENARRAWLTNPLKQICNSPPLQICSPGLPRLAATGRDMPRLGCCFFPIRRFRPAVVAARYNVRMETQSIVAPIRRPRFRRASEPPAFRVTDDDVEIVRQLARHRFLRSTHIAALVGRSLDRTNDRLARLFHARYLDRPRAQLDYYPTSGSAPMVYALADRGARLLIERDGIEFANVEWSRKNFLAGLPFIEHQLELMDFYVALECAARDRGDVRLIHPDELVAALPD